MSGLPTPEEFDASLRRIHADTLHGMTQAEASGDRKEIGAFRKLVEKSEKLLRQRGIDPTRL